MILWELKGHNYYEYNCTLNYIGPHIFQKILTKFFPIHKLFEVINFISFLHDYRYSKLFTMKLSWKEFLKNKSQIDILYIKDSSGWSYLLSLPFFLIINLFTPIYLITYLFVR